MKRSASLVLLLLVKTVTAQPLDWSGDMTIFGTSADEQQPAISAAGMDTLHAFCIVAEDSLALKRSTDAGASWSVASMIASTMSNPQITATSDNAYSYYVCSSAQSTTKHLYRLTTSVDEWSEALETELPPGFGGNIDALAAATDVAAQPSEPYLNVCWIEGVQTGLTGLCFVQSRDRGGTFLSPVLVHAQQIFADLAAGVAIAETWSGEAETLHIAATQDRPGSVPEEIRLYRSTNQGQQWNGGVTLDSSAYAQLDPALVSFGNTLCLAYTRRSDVTAQRDIYFVYSPDGGVTFSDPVSLTDAISDDFEPRLAVDATGQFLHIFYLSGQVLEEESTLMLITAPVAAPWDVSDPVAISDSNSVASAGGYYVTPTTAGIAAVWTARFALGDLDVHFDASWRGNGVTPRSEVIPATIGITACYPNPFNGSTTVTIRTPMAQRLALDVTDLLGRRIETISLDAMSPGSHNVRLNFPELSSGNYWLSLRGSPAPPLRLTLLR